MPAFYEGGPNGLWVFLLVTVILGGAAAWATGRAIASTWKPLWQLAFYLLLLAAAVRFIHYALFAEPLLALANYAVDAVTLIAVGFAGHRATRLRQMARQYGWLGGLPEKQSI